MRSKMRRPRGKTFLPRKGGKRARQGGKSQRNEREVCRKKGGKRMACWMPIYKKSQRTREKVKRKRLLKEGGQKACQEEEGLLSMESAGRHWKNPSQGKNKGKKPPQG